MKADSIEKLLTVCEHLTANEQESARDIVEVIIEETGNENRARMSELLFCFIEGRIDRSQLSNELFGAMFDHKIPDHGY